MRQGGRTSTGFFTRRRNGDHGSRAFSMPTALANRRNLRRPPDSVISSTSGAKRSTTRATRSASSRNWRTLYTRTRSRTRRTYPLLRRSGRHDRRSGRPFEHGNGIVEVADRGTRPAALDEIDRRGDLGSHRPGAELAALEQLARLGRGEPLDVAGVLGPEPTLNATDVGEDQ